MPRCCVAPLEYRRKQRARCHIAQDAAKSLSQPVASVPPIRKIRRKINARLSAMNKRQKKDD
jgi:hypothetical protein